MTLLVVGLLTACTPSGPASSLPEASESGGSPSPSELYGGSYEKTQATKLAFEGDLYDVPVPMPAGERGELMRIQAIPADGHRQYLVLYHSESISGEDLAVTGTLWIPPGQPPEGGWPIVSFGPGTHGHFSDACPYSNVEAWNPPEYLDLLDRLLAEGFVIAYTDWQGLGTRFPYTYAVGETETYALLDAARAARDLLGPDASDRIFLIGHSVGGDGVMASIKFGPAYDDGLDVRGAVILDGSSDHRTHVQVGLASSDPSLLMFGVLGYTRAYPELRLEDVMVPEAIEDMDFWDTTPCNVDPPWDGTFPQDVFHTSPLDLEPWLRRIEEGIPGSPSYPVFYPVADAEPVLDERVSAGERVGAEIVHYPAPIDHYSIIGAAMEDYIAWLNALK
jgi:hypothetical protein